MKYYALFLAAMSLVTLCLYAADKRKAKKHKWRIPEATLLGFGFCGGALGALIGMKLCHHKTKKWYFWTVNLLGLAIQAAVFFIPWK